MKCALGQCGRCQFGPSSSAATAPCSRTSRSSRCSRCRSSDGGRAQEGSGSSPRATGASLLDCEDELLTLADEIEIAHFLEASSGVVAGPYDLSLVEGSITTPEDAERIRQSAAHRPVGHDRRLRDRGRHPGAAQLRRRSRVHVRRLRDAGVCRRSRASTPISAHVPVDYELHGCPVNKHQLLEVLSAYLNERPAIPSYSVCIECKRRGNVCVMVAHEDALLGPVARRLRRGLRVPPWLLRRFGPMESPNRLARGLAAGRAGRDLLRSLELQRRRGAVPLPERGA